MLPREEGEMRLGCYVAPYISSHVIKQDSLLIEDPLLVLQIALSSIDATLVRNHMDLRTINPPIALLNRISFLCTSSFRSWLQLCLMSPYNFCSRFLPNPCQDPTFPVILKPFSSLCQVEFGIPL